MEKKIIGGEWFLIDTNNNMINLRTFKEKDAKEMLLSLVNCFNCIDSEHLTNCKNMIYCFDCIDSFNCVSSASLTNCSDCCQCENLTDCIDCFKFSNNKNIKNGVGKNEKYRNELFN